MVKEVVIIILQEIFGIQIFKKIKIIILILTKIMVCKIEITITEITIIDHWIHDSIQTWTQDSFKIEIKHIKIYIYKMITTSNKIQVVRKWFAITLKNLVIYSVTARYDRLTNHKHVIRKTPKLSPARVHWGKHESRTTGIHF